MVILASEAEPTRVRLLLDTNVVIALEPFSGEMEPSFPLAARLVRLINEQGHFLCVAQATKDDLIQGRDTARRRQRLAELEKLHLLAEVPVSTALTTRAGESTPGTNDHRDLRILAALEAGAANYLVSEDARLRRRAKRAGLADAVLTLAEAVDLLQGFAPTQSPPPPRVSEIPAYSLDLEQAIFASLRDGYADFDQWLQKVQRDSANRRCLAILEEGVYAAIAILKFEAECGYSFASPILKICTFKVAPEFSGVKYGELLLKAIFYQAPAASIDSLYVEIFEEHQLLIALFEEFGFIDSGRVTGRGEKVLLKRLLTRDERLPALEYHIAHGPPALKLHQQIFVVPIQPQWHTQLFPELATQGETTTQPSLFPVDTAPLTHPWGNALRKAYLCNSSIGRIRPGDVLLFYRSQDRKAVDVIGVVEETLRSQDPHEVLAFVGRRTVYTPTEIAGMSRRGDGVLAIRFRQDRPVSPPWSMADLTRAGVLSGWPQSITSVPEEGKAWIRARLFG